MSETRLQCPKCGENRRAFLEGGRWRGKISCVSCGYKFKKLRTAKEVQEEEERLKKEEEEWLKQEEEERLKQEEEERLKQEEKQRLKQEEEERLKQEEEKRKHLHLNIQEKLKTERDGGSDYLGIDSALREEVEAIFSGILSRPLKDWKPYEARIFRTLVDYPLRKEYLSLLSKKDDTLMLKELKKITALTEIQLKAIAELGPQFQALTSQVKGVKVGTTVTGMLAAKELGDHLADSFED